MIYPIGIERIFIYDHRGLALSPDEEYLIIRLGDEGVFESWFIHGASPWPAVVGEPGCRTYREKRGDAAVFGNPGGTREEKVTQLNGMKLSRNP